MICSAKALRRCTICWMPQTVFAHKKGLPRNCTPLQILTTNIPCATRPESKGIGPKKTMTMRIKRTSQTCEQAQSCCVSTENQMLGKTACTGRTNDQYKRWLTTSSLVAPGLRNHAISCFEQTEVRVTGLHSRVVAPVISGCGSETASDVPSGLVWYWGGLGSLISCSISIIPIIPCSALFH